MRTACCCMQVHQGRQNFVVASTEVVCGAWVQLVRTVPSGLSSCSHPIEHAFRSLQCLLPPVLRPCRYLDMLERMAYLERLRELRRLKEAGGELPQWQQQAAQRDAAAAAAANPQPLLSFTPSVELNELARPADRWAPRGRPQRKAVPPVPHCHRALSLCLCRLQHAAE